MALEDKAVPTDFTPAAAITAAIQARIQDGKLPCAAAFAIAAEHEVAPRTVGQTADVLNIHLTSCQLGLFGYPGHAKGWSKVAEAPVPDGLEAALRAAAGGGPLACGQLWALAAELGVSRLQIGYVADQLEIKITPCQLGAF